jgi:diadenosine tetraphosphatase ApaH/serine/threonine PP2A family protein phosphatase
MRRLVLSDVHANVTALAAALAACRGRWDEAVCLGDLVGYGPDPNEVIDQIRPLVSAIIRGNHDKAVGGLGDLEDFNPVARSSVEWTRRQLRPENLEYLANLPAGPLRLDGLTLVHGAFHDEDEYVFVPEQALDGLLVAPGTLTFFGHTHMQGGFAFRDSELETIALKPPRGEAAFSTLQIHPDSRYLLNPGSIGQPRDGDPRAAFAIADSHQSLVEFWRVPYDIASVQRRLRRAHLPEPLAARLASGH